LKQAQQLRDVIGRDLATRQSPGAERGRSAKYHRQQGVLSEKIVLIILNVRQYQVETAIKLGNQVIHQGTAILWGALHI